MTGCQEGLGGGSHEPGVLCRHASRSCFSIPPKPPAPPSAAWAWDAHGQSSLGLGEVGSELHSAALKVPGKTPPALPTPPLLPSLPSSALSVSLCLPPPFPSSPPSLMSDVVGDRDPLPPAASPYPPHLPPPLKHRRHLLRGRFDGEQERACMLQGGRGCVQCHPSLEPDRLEFDPGAAIYWFRVMVLEFSTMSWPGPAMYSFLYPFILWTSI